MTECRISGNGCSWSPESRREAAAGVTMRVVAHLAGSAAFGGGERYIELLCDRLSRMKSVKYRQVVICPEPGPFVDRMSGRGVPVHVVRLAPLINPAALGRLAGMLRREGVTILQTHGARSNAYGQVAGRLAGVPVIISTVHNSIRAYEVPAWKQRGYLAVLRCTSRWADRVICVSEALRRHVVAEMGVPSARAVVVYNGIDPTMQAASGRAATVRREFDADTAPLLVTIGRLTPQKGHRYLLDALPGLLPCWPRLRCVIIGEGELQSELRAQATRLGIEHALQFAGVRQDIPEILAAADIFVLPSVSEGFPFALLEALAMGRPVVATQIPGVDELIASGRTGWLAPSEDPSGLAAVLQEVLADPAKAEAVGREGARMVRERFTADHMVAQTVALYEETLSQRGAA